MRDFFERLQIHLQANIVFAVLSKVVSLRGGLLGPRGSSQPRTHIRLCLCRLFPPPFLYKKKALFFFLISLLKQRVLSSIFAA